MPKEFTWESLQRMTLCCTACPLSRTRQNVVPGEGSHSAKLLCIGEGPGAQEDAQGRPFVGPAGKLLDRMLSAIGLAREDVYIANVVKCRPPGNRVPTPEEARACLPFLRAQVYLLRPRVILILGATAAKYTLDENIRITRDRGRWIYRGGAWMLATYHPAALLRDPSKKTEAWEDMQAVRDKLSELENDGAKAKSPDSSGKLEATAPPAALPSPNLVDMAVASMSDWAREMQELDRQKTSAESES